MTAVAMPSEPRTANASLSSDAHGTFTSVTTSRPPPGPRHSAQPASAAIAYNPRNPLEQHPRQPATPAFPTPHIRPRQRRPHTIHIVSYPPGYVPTDLRTSRQPGESRSAAAAKKTQNKSKSSSLKRSIPRKKRSAYFLKRANPTAPPVHTASPGSRALDKLLSAFITQPSPLRAAAPGRIPARALPAPTSQASVQAVQPSVPTQSTQPSQHTSRPASLISLGRRLSHPPSQGSGHSDDHTANITENSADQTASRAVPAVPAVPTVDHSNDPETGRETSHNAVIPSPGRVADHPGTSSDHVPPNYSADNSADDSARAEPFTHVPAPAVPAATVPMTRNPVVVDALRQDPHVITGTQSNRNSFMSVRSSVKNIMTSSVSEITEKPIATGGGLSCTIFLAEPNVFLTGFDHDGHTSRSSNNGTALLRGKLQLHVTKNIKIRAVTLKLHGKARTEWPEGIPPLKLELYEEESLRTQALTFFHAMHESWESPYGNQCTYSLKSPVETFVASLNKRSATNGSDHSSGTLGMTAKDIKRLSLQQVQTRSFGKGDSPLAHPVQAKGYKVFPPGMYEYSFELPIDHHQLETIKLPFGFVRWDLEATVERAGAFKPNLHGSREVNIIRVPDQLSLETVEPISISRQWEDQLFYDIVISGKSFPIGGKIPIAFKLTPLAKVQLHKVKVFVTESAEYWTNNRRVTRKDPGRKILLFEKSAGKPLEDKYVGSEINFTSGGELSSSERAEARATAARRRAAEAAGTYSSPVPLPEPSDNLLGDLDLGLESYWGATEIEMNVQIPTCDQMAKNPNLRLHPDCSWRNANVYHWIKVVMRISRLDADDPEGKRRRHFEISIDSPFTVLSCLATQANIGLPQYSGVSPSVNAMQRTSATCGCHDAPATVPSSPATSIDLSLANAQGLPIPPQAAHLQTQSVESLTSEARAAAVGPSSNSQERQRSAHIEQEESQTPRPIHLLRVPSFAPPAFDADESPPIPMDITTPPPNYDAIVGTPSVDGLADYFSRLANYEHPDEAVEDDSDSDSDNMHMPTRIASRGGRVNVRTPGARHGPSRSMDIERPTVPMHLSMASVLRRNAV